MLPKNNDEQPVKPIDVPGYYGPERRCGVPYCPREEDHTLTLKRIRLDSARTMLLNYLVSSAAIAVIVLVFHVWRAVRQELVRMEQMVVATIEQNRILTAILKESEYHNKKEHGDGK